MEEKYPEELYDKFFVARQPIFTAQMRVWGYELLFRHGEGIEEAVFEDGDQATTQLIADGYNLAVRGMRQGAKALVNFPRRMLVGEAPYVLPADQCVVEILETVTPEPEVVNACLELKKRGYALALDDFEGESGFEPLCELVDIIKIDVLGKTPAQVRAIVEGVKKYEATLLAEKVESHDIFKVCRSLGFTYFQGFFFNRPEIIPGRKLSTSQINKIKLLKELGSPEVNSSRLVEIIQTDLVHFVSTAQVYQLRVFRIADKSHLHPARRCPCSGPAICGNGCRWSSFPTSTRRTRPTSWSVFPCSGPAFCIFLPPVHPVPFDQDGMFLLGFFSLLDAILDQSMGLVLEEIPLDPAIKRALVDQDDQGAAWVELLDEIDRCNWPRLTSKAGELGVPITLVNRLSAEASIWATWVMS
jgi:c-di-GMP phosphodiesterase